MLRKTKQYYKNHDLNEKNRKHWKDIELDKFNWKCEIAKK